METDEPILPLRAHHLMCVTTYRGKGYSPEFVANMNRVWHAVRDGVHARARAISVADPLCLACPNLQDPAEPASCLYQRSIEARDRRMLDVMGWSEGEVVPLSETLDLIHDRHAELMQAVCEGCDWTDICSERRFTLREAEPPVPRPEPSPVHNSL